MSRSSTPGQNLVSRLAQRNQGGLYRRQIAGGGEVMTGPTATAALRALGARAFTMDNTIFVSEDFDESTPEDQALYAHERHHALNSGGDGAAESYYDAEEVAARAIERMVLHRAAAGEDFGSIMRDVDSTRIQRSDDVQISRSANADSVQHRQTPRAEDDAATQAYSALLQQGRTQEGVIQELGEYCLEVLSGSTTERFFQGGTVGFV